MHITRRIAVPPGHAFVEQSICYVQYLCRGSIAHAYRALGWRACSADRGGRHEDLQEHDLTLPAVISMCLPELDASKALCRYSQAKLDAEKAVALRPEWVKAQARLAAAHAGMRQLDAAAAAYTTCLKLAPGNMKYTTALKDIVVSSVPPISQPWEACMGLTCCPAVTS